MKRTILIGPLPPPLGGATVLFKQLVDELAYNNEIQLKVINTYLIKRNSTGENRHIIFRFFNVMFSLLTSISNFDSVGCHVSKNGFLIFSPLIVFLCKVFKKKSIIRKFGGELKNTYQKAGFVSKALIGYSMRADVVFLETISQVDFFREKYPDANIIWYPNSRKSSSFVKKTFEVNKKFIFLAHVKKEKGILDLIDAVKGLDVSLDIYGPLEGIDSSHLQSANVFYRGLIKPEDVQSVLVNYSALILPTYYEGEGYPGVIIEAYSVGLPVISTNWRDIPEIIDHKETGLIIPVKRPDLIRQAILDILADPVLYQNLCEGARRKFSKFDASELSDLYVSYL